jgi:hypothetical protein
MRRATRLMACLACLCLAGAAGLRAGENEAGSSPQPTSASVQLRQSLQELRQADIVAPEASPSDSLLEAIRKLQAMRVPARLTPQPAPIEESPAPEMPPATQPAAPVEPARPRIPPEVLQLLQDAPEAAAEPAVLADALFVSGYDEAAHVLYERAVKLAEAEKAEAGADEDRKARAKEKEAWLLFQQANSRRRNNPDGAIELYKRVAGEHADSPWAVVASVQAGMLEWRRTQHVDEILDSVRAVSAPTTAPSP